MSHCPVLISSIVVLLAASTASAEGPSQPQSTDNSDRAAASYFAVGASGAVTAGTVTADAYNGSGAELTNLPAASLAGQVAVANGGTGAATAAAARANLGAAAENHSHDGSPYGNVVIVATSGGDYTTVQDALDSIADAAADNRYLVWVGPGVYSGAVTMKQYVDIEGAGELVTTLTHTGVTSPGDGTVVTADDAELRFLTVENTGGSTYALAINNYNASPRITHVTAKASGGTSTSSAVYSWDSTAVMTHVTARATGGDVNQAIYNSTGAHVTMTDVVAEASGGSANQYAIYNSSARPVMTNVTATATGGTWAIALYNRTNASAPPIADHVTATASGGSVLNFGVYNYASWATFRDSTITASGTSAKGIRNTASSGAHTVTIDRCQIVADLPLETDSSYYTTRVGVTQLSGSSAVSGTFTCVGVYDENYTAFDTDCLP